MSGERSVRHLEVVRTARVPCRGALGPATREAWIACHGYGQLAADFLRQLEPLAAPDRALLAPEGLNRFYLDPTDRPAAERRVGATWMTREDRERDIADTVRYLEAVAAEARAAAPAARLVGLGFSQGAAAIARWAVTSSLPLARLVLWGAGPPEDLDLDRARRRLPSIPVALVAGERDDYATPARIAAAAAALRALGATVAVLAFPGGHRLDAATLARVAAGDAGGGAATP